MIYKDPVTDTDKIKKSQTGMVCVMKNPNGLELMDKLTEIQRQNVRNDVLEDVFVDGELLRNESLADIRKRLFENL
jgi:hypothetical protein